MHSQLIPLHCLERGDCADVADVHGDEHWVKRLAELGLRPGIRVRMLQPGSPCLLSVGALRLSVRLDRCANVLVRLVRPESQSEVA